MKELNLDGNTRQKIEVQRSMRMSTSQTLSIGFRALLAATLICSCDRPSASTEDEPEIQIVVPEAFQTIRLNAGGGDLEVANPDQSLSTWRAGSNFAVGGMPYMMEEAVDTLNLPAAAPAEIYATARHDDHAYGFPELPAGRYRVRLHFVDPSTEGDRKVDIDVGDTRVLAAYDPRTAAGASHTVVIEDVITDVTEGGLLIACGKGAGTDVFVAAIEVFAVDSAMPLTPAAVTRTGGTKTTLPKDTEWLRGLCGDGALAHSDGQRIFITELSGDGQSIEVGSGLAPEWSPDGQYLAWIDGITVRGRCRTGDPEVRVIASGVSPQAGVHWVDESSVIVRFQDGAEGQWARVNLGGETWPESGIDPLGHQGLLTDLRVYGEAWSYVAERKWTTSAGKSGHIGGHSTASISPDGKTVTALQEGGQICKLNAIQKDGHQGTLHWNYAGSFDQHRWSSNDSRFVVCRETETSTLAVIEVATSRATAIATTTGTNEFISGDFTVGAAKAGAWPAADGAPPIAAQVIATGAASIADGVTVEKDSVIWPRDRNSLLFLWEDQSKENFVTDSASGSTRRAGGTLQGAARYSSAHGISLQGGSYTPNDFGSEFRAACSQHNAFSLELTLRVDSPGGANKGRIATFGIGGETPDLFTLEDLGGELWFTIRPDDIKGEEEAPAWRLGRLLPGQYHHVLISYEPGRLVGFLDGREAFSSDGLQGLLSSWKGDDGSLIFGRPPWIKEPAWDGHLEAMAIRTAPLQDKSTLELYALALRRLEGREAIPRILAKAILKSIAKVPTPEKIAPYRRALVEGLYSVQEVVSGEIAEQEIRVLHWVIEDAQDLGFRWELGEQYFLKLESAPAHLELKNEYQSSLHPPRPVIPGFLEMGRSPVKVDDEG